MYKSCIYKPIYKPIDKAIYKPEPVLSRPNKYI